MKFLKIKKALLLALTILTTLQTLTVICMENNGNWLISTIFSTISSFYGKTEKNVVFENYIEKIEDKQIEDTTSFKYTASMAHLMTVLPEKITLTPKPQYEKNQKTWLWSTGVLSDKKYCVTYQNKTYISTYDPEKQSWETTDANQMDYFTYYDYLSNNKKLEIGEKGIEKENFMRYLIEKATKQNSEEIFNIKKDAFADNSLIETFKNALLEEEKHKEKYTFYHGYSAGFDFWYDFITLLNYYLYGSEDYIERSQYERVNKDPLKIYSSTQSFLEDTFLKKQFDGNDLEPRVGTFLMANTVSLFGNLIKGDHCGEACCSYFCSGENICITADNNPPLDKTKILCGITEKDASLKSTLKELYKEYKKLGGKLKQCFISPKHTNAYVYIAKPGGFPMKEEATSTISNLRNGDFREKIEYTDSLQARIIHFSPLFINLPEAKKCGLLIRYYYHNPNGRSKHIELRKKTDAIVRENIERIIKKNNIVLTEENQTAMKKRLETPYRELKCFMEL